MRNKCITCFSVTLFTLLFCSFSTARTIFVNLRASGANNGSSWNNAFVELSSALAVATDGDQIWITNGIYTPTLGTDRARYFSLKTGVSLYGSFVGTEINLQERRFTNISGTILSGNIGDLSNKNDNSYHVVKGENINNVLLDHVSINSGNANGLDTNDKKGAGLYLTFSGATNYSITFNYFSISSCDAETGGGGAYISCTNNTTLSVTASFTQYFSNTAALGASVFWDLTNAKGTIQSYVESYHDAKAADAGGGVYIRNTQNSSFVWDGRSVDFMTNQSINKGGGFVLSSSDNSIAKIDWKSLNGLDNNLSHNVSTKGGMAYLESINNSDNTFSVDNPILEQNLVSGVNTEGAVISNNTVSGRSKIVLSNASKIADNAIVNTNLSANPKGTIIYNYGTNATSSVTLANCQTSKCFNRTGSGGVVFNDDNQAQIALTRCVVDSSVAGKDGGVVYMNGGHLTIDSSILTHSEAGGVGSVVFFQAQEGEHKIDIKHSQFKDSKSKNTAVYLSADNNAVIKPYLFKNLFLAATNLQVSDVAGSFISFRATNRMAKISTGKVIQCVFQNGKGYAGAVLHEAAGGLCEVTYSNILFHNNTAETATMLNKATNTEGVCTIINQNTLFWKNNHLSGGNGRTVVNQQDNTTAKPRPTFSYCLMPESDCTALDQSVCTNNVFGQDPLLIQVYPNKPEYLEYAPCSPAINAGNNGFIPSELSFIDAPFRKDPRIVDGKVDIGVSEYIGNNHEYAKILDEPNRSLLADKAYQDSLGWTHYYNCIEKKLILSVKLDSASIGKLSDSLKVRMTTTADYGIKAKILRGADYLSPTSACDKWYVMNRFWDISGAKALSRATDVCFYFMPKDSADLKKAIPYTPYSDVVTYQVTKATAHDTVVKAIGGNFTKQVFTTQTASLSEWFLKPNVADNAPFMGAYRISQFQMADLNGSGSAGVLKLAGSIMADIDTFLCQNEKMKIGDFEFSGGFYENYLIKLKTIDGCDSIIRVNMTSTVQAYKSFSTVEHDNGFNSGFIIADYATNFSHSWSNGVKTHENRNLKAGFYTDTIIINNRCKYIFTFEIKLVKAFDIPNAFTPNGDGLNDTFNAITNGKPTIKAFKIFNRIGQLVYDNETPNTGWDGNIKGQEAASDVYVYWIELDYGNGHILKERGEVSLIR